MVVSDFALSDHLRARKATIFIFGFPVFAAFGLLATFGFLSTFGFLATFVMVLVTILVFVLTTVVVFAGIAYTAREVQRVHVKTQFDKDGYVSRCADISPSTPTTDSRLQWYWQLKTGFQLKVLETQVE